MVIQGACRCICTCWQHTKGSVFEQLLSDGFWLLVLLTDNSAHTTYACKSSSCCICSDIKYQLTKRACVS